MRRQLVTLGFAVAGIVLAFLAGTAIASHLSSTHGGSSGGSSSGSRYGGFGYGYGGPARGHLGFSGNGAIGAVTRVSGDQITIRSFRFGSEKIAVTGSTSFSVRKSFTTAPTSGSISDVKKGDLVFAQGTRSGGQLVAKTIEVMAVHHRFGGFGFGFGQGYGFNPRSNGQSTPKAAPGPGI